MRKHPHARGEDSFPASGRPQRRETPPRTWGRPVQGEGRAPICGNTPTHVGKTLFRPQDVPREEKHPHARGEDVSDGTTRGQYRETPPRTWGRHTHQMALRMKERNTPTHVGKTSAGRPAAYRRWKHPHARGEDSLYTSSGEGSLETPPRTWGRLPPP